MAGLFEKFKTQVVNSAITAVSAISPFKIEEMKPDTYLSSYAKYQKVLTKEGFVLYKVANHHEMVYMCHEDSSTDHLFFNGIRMSKSIIPISLFRIQSYEEAVTIFEAYSRTINIIAMSSSCVKDRRWLERICTAQREHLAYNPAHVAAFLDLVDCLQNKLIQQMLNEQDNCTLATPLHVAIENKNKAFVVAIMDLADVRYDLADASGNTVLHLATMNNDHETLKALLDKTTTCVNNMNVAGKSAIHLACEQGNTNCIDVLLASGADSALSCCEVYPIHAAMMADCLEGVAKLCARSPSVINLQDPREGCTALFYAKTRKAVFFLADLSADLDKPNVQQVTPLHAAVRAGNFEATFALLLRGADPSICDSRGESPLHSAVSCGQVTTAKRKDEKSYAGAPTVAGNLDMVRALIIFEADVNAKNVDGLSPRHVLQTAKNSCRDLLLHTLHNVGALPCSPETLGCWIGCRHGTVTTGTAPNPAVCEKVYDMDAAERLLRAVHSVTPPGSGEKLLCLDGGGIRGLILIQVLRAVERCCGRPVHELFDWVAGTSTGGILALCIAHKRSLAHARGLYFMMKDEVFCGKRPYDTAPLEKVMKREFGEHTFMTDVSHPKVMVMGLLADRFPPDLHIFRNYPSPVEEQPAHVASMFHAVTAPNEQLVWRAARASGAAPTFFRACGRFLDGGLISNNPTLDALTEVHMYKVALSINKDGDNPILPLSMVVSIGTGRIPLTSVSQIDVYRPNTPLEAIRFAQGIQSLGKILVEMATVTEGRIVDRARAWCHMANIGFTRLSPPISSDIALDTVDTSLLLQMLWETEVYLHRNALVVGELASALIS